MMKKKLVCLLLCAMMLLTGTMTSCSSGEVDPSTQKQNSQARAAMTLVWAMVCDKVPSEETQATIQNAINKITKARYTTQVILEFYTTEEYSTVVEEKLALNQEEVEKAEEAKSAWKKFLRAHKTATAENGETYKVETEEIYRMFWESYPEYEKYVQPVVEVDEEESVTEAETVQNEYGLGELKYPDPAENQIDILYVSGYTSYSKYINNEWLSRLDDELSQSSKVLKDYIFPAFISAAKTSMGTYAIPNNSAIGEYTYLLLNKELMQKYYYSEGSIDGLTSKLCQDFLLDVASYEPGYVPLLSNELTRKPQNVLYWSVDYEAEESSEEDQDYVVTAQTVKYDRFSVLGCIYAKELSLEKKGVIYNCGTLLQNVTYQNQLKVLKGYECDGYYGANEAETRPFAAGIVSGGAQLVEEYGDNYYMVIVDYPRGNEADLFGNMWAVSAYTKDVSRAMEIITYLNTNADFRNLVQYGIQDVNYQVLTKEVVDPITKETVSYTYAKRLNDSYMMDVYKTGNVFMAYPDETMPYGLWNYGKQQNQDALIDPTVGFSVSDLSEKENVLNLEAMKMLEELSRRVEADLAKCKTVKDLEIFFSGYKIKTPVEGEDLGNDLAIGTDWNSVSEIYRILAEYNGISSTEKAGSVSGIGTVLQSNKYLEILRASEYNPEDAAEVDKNGNVIKTNLEAYGPGYGLYSRYRQWAIDNGWYVEPTDDE